MSKSRSQIPIPEKFQTASERCGTIINDDLYRVTIEIIENFYRRYFVWPKLFSSRKPLQILYSAYG